MQRVDKVYLQIIRDSQTQPSTPLANGVTASQYAHDLLMVSCKKRRKSSKQHRSERCEAIKEEPIRKRCKSEPDSS